MKILKSAFKLIPDKEAGFVTDLHLCFLPLRAQGSWTCANPKPSSADFRPCSTARTKAFSSHAEGLAGVPPKPLRVLPSGAGLCVWGREQGAVQLNGSLGEPLAASGYCGAQAISCLPWCPCWEMWRHEVSSPVPGAGHPRALPRPPNLLVKG